MTVHCSWELKKKKTFLFNCPFKILFIYFYFFLFFYYLTYLKFSTLNKLTNSRLSQTLKLSPLYLTVAGPTRTSTSPAHRSSIIQNKARLHEQSQRVATLQRGLSLRHRRTSQRLANHSRRGPYKQRSSTPWPHSDFGERDRETVRWAPRCFIADLHLHHRPYRHPTILICFGFHGFLWVSWWWFGWVSWWSFGWVSWVSGGVVVLVVICVVVFG